MRGFKQRGYFFLIMGAGALAGVGWAWERNRTTRLQWQLEALRGGAAERARLQQEHDRFLSRQPAAGELERLRREMAALPPPAAGTKKDEIAAGTDHSFQRGRWAAPAEWRNCGRSTPEAALETTFWAAAGGDLGVLKDAFEFDEAARVRAREILAGLPESLRRSYATPEDFLTLLAAREIPLMDAQWFARTNHDADTVTDSVLLRNAEGKTKQGNLTFHRGENGWRLVVPVQVVERGWQKISQPLSPPN